MMQNTFNSNTCATLDGNDKFSKNWHPDQTLFLIDLYKQCEDLYNTNSKFYNDSIVKNCYLQIIVRKLSTVRPITTLKEVKSRIKSLHQRFRKHLSSFPNGLSDSESDVLLPNELWCFKELEFLKDYIQNNTDSTKSTLSFNPSVEDLQNSIYTNIEILKSSSLQASKNGDSQSQQLSNSKDIIMQRMNDNQEKEKNIIENEKNQNEDNNEKTLSTKNTNSKNAEYIEKLKEEVKSYDPKDDSVLKSLANTIQILTNRPDEIQDPLTIFGQYVEAELKMIKDVKLLNQCKRAISKAILNFQELDEEKTE